MSKNVAVFVDVANIFYAAKAAGVDIDYVTLLKSATAGRDLVRAYAYTGLDPDNENQRNFHDFLRRSNYKVVSKDIRKYGDGKVKANLDIELVVDMMKTARNLDIAIVVSGDGDFAPAIRAVPPGSIDRLDAAVSINATHAAAEIFVNSPPLRARVLAGKLKIVAARYDLDDGKVTPARG